MICARCTDRVVAARLGYRSAGLKQSVEAEGIMAEGLQGRAPTPNSCLGSFCVGVVVP